MASTMRNQWGTFTVTAVEAARLKSIPLPDDMRRAITIAMTTIGGRIAAVIPTEAEKQGPT